MSMWLPIGLFGLQLYGQLIKLGAAASQAGIFISPLSAYLALIIALNGAGPLSQTQKELWVLLSQQQLPANLASVTSAEAALNSQVSTIQKDLLAQSGGNGTQLVVANALWTNQTTIKQPFANNMLTQFQAPVTSVSSAAPINAWADKATKGLIKTAVPADAEFKAVITSAMYFKGAWVQPFPKVNTRKMDFNLAPEHPVKVDMMYESFREGVQFAEVPNTFRAVKLPYKGSNIVAIAVLPDIKQYGYDADKALLGIGTDKILGCNWQDASTAEPSLRVYMPKFKVKADMLPVGKALKALGVSAAFNPDLADFSRLSDEPLYITDVLQSVVVIVDEVGTEAAAVTSILAGATAYMPEKMTDPIVFDRPFIFLVWDASTELILFMGTVRDPSKAQ